jgi:endonuclease YncB( thermonuclease family)
MRSFNTRLIGPLFLSFFLTSIFAGVTLADSHTAKIVGITDGDTATAVLSSGQSVNVRLEGIDAPEHGQAFAAASEKHLSELILGKAVTLDCSALDPYQRLVCKILLPNGDDVDLDQIKAGMAWHYKQYQRLQSATDRAAYGAAEDAARRARLGLWADAGPMQPQDFRHGTRSELCLDNHDHRIACSETYDGPVRGNMRSNIYHWPGCPNYDDIAEHNRVEFPNAIAAEQAGYRAARNCP